MRGLDGNVETSTAKITTVDIINYSSNNNNNLNNMENNNNTLGTTISLPKPQHANEEITSGVQDTIYLCNFRVSVDGEWLCLKELQDLDIQDGKKTGSSKSGGYSGAVEEINNGHGNFGIGNNEHFYESTTTNNQASNNSGFNKSERDWVNYYSRDPASIERSNLVNICKLVVKELLEQSLRFGRQLDSDHLPLQHFFIVLEHVLRHGLRPKKGLLGPKKELWDLLQSVEKYCFEAQDVTASVRDLPTVRTHIGRARAWLRIALMQKKLADYLQSLIEQRDDTLLEYYEPHALMMSDEVIVIMGILVGLNVIDCNLCVKEEDLDSQQGVIDFSLYLRSSSRNSPTEDDNNTAFEPLEGNMTAVLDQKNYIEELNRHLNATVGNLQAKVETITTTNALMKEDLAIARNSLLALQAENQALRRNIGSSNHHGTTHSASSIHNNSDNSSNSSQSSNKSNTNNNDTITELTNNITEERKKTQELEKELKLQVSLKAETDMAMKLLEKDIHEKQDTIVSLRRQLDDIKQINLEMYRKLQECEGSLKHKTELLTKLETQKEDLTHTIGLLENKWSTDKSSMNAMQDSLKALSNQVTNGEERAALAEADIRIERDWRISLQTKEVKLKEQINSLQNYVKQLNDETQKCNRLKDDLDKSRKQWTEAQHTLEELGIQLSENKLKVAELQEKLRQQEKLSTFNELATSSGWIPDNSATNCKECNKEFSMTRRKHHCRNCGEIFCNNCSEKTIPLINDNGQLSKPVRVCDKCYNTVSNSDKT